SPALATLSVCVLLVVGFVAAVARLTHGFDAWTYDELRRHSAADGALHAPAMALRDARGTFLRVFDGVEPRAPVYLVDFIYTRCPTLCQVLGGEYSSMQSSLLADPSRTIRLLSISIDPRRDSQPALAAHGRLHRADSSLWTIAAPRTEDDGREALRRLGIVAIPDGFGGYVHNGGIHLIDASGRVHRIFDHAQWPEALAAARALAAMPSP
ncbi:MAG: SCO family protein, partial [Burkholderiales bacterium]|nr:SCO family protein [Burkholderiales bacterium]